jgi:hypothetical protein
MASNNYGYFSDFDVHSLGQMQLQPFPDEFSFDQTPFGIFNQAQIEVTTYEYPAVRSWDNSLRAPLNWGETPTASNISSNNTPLPPNDQSSSDNGLSCQVSSESKRKLDLIDQSSLNKRPKLADGHAHTARKRKVACISCQMKTSKHRCMSGPDPAGPCLACSKRAKALGPVMICRRGRYQDINFIRWGPSKDIAETKRWLKTPLDSERPKWKRLTDLQTSQNYIELRLSQGHSNSTLNLRVQGFNPVEGDKTSYPWYDNGAKHFYECPHYAIAETDHATEQIRLFIDLNMERYIYQLLPDTSDPRAIFIRRVFKTALDRADEYPLVKSALKFWVAGRFIEDPWKIQGHETLGMKLDHLPASPFSQHIPVTPIMNFQIDNIVIHDHLTIMLGKIRKAMKKRILPIKKKDWFEIHLATIILLYHVDLTMKHDIDFARLRNMSKRFSNRPLIEMITFSANALLSFHQHEKGHFPLSAPNWTDVETSYSFTDPQKSYLLEARKLIKQIKVSRNPGDDLFWTSQIYDSKWEPKVVEDV